jgi:TfoX/Sxy family transcriptional regulator of competence genes
VPVDPRTLERVRELFSGRSDVEEKRMVGGRSFVVRGHLCCGVTAQGLVVRLGPEGAARARDETHVRPLVMGGREVTAFVVVDPEGYADDDELARWVSRAVASVEDKS